jgi:hypothetical protein
MRRKPFDPELCRASVSANITARGRGSTGLYTGEDGSTAATVVEQDGEILRERYA